MVNEKELGSSVSYQLNEKQIKAIDSAVRMKETNILSSEFQQKMREVLHEWLIENPRAGNEMEREIGIGVATLKRFLNKGMSLRSKQAYILIGFLKKHYQNEF